MSNNYGLNKYKQTSVTTASRGQILLMLYEAAIKNTKIAIDATMRRDLAEKGKYILKVQHIINELSLTLDHSANTPITGELERLYVYMIDQITDANIKCDPIPLRTVLKLLETLYDGWKGAVDQVNKNGGDAASLAKSETITANPLTKPDKK